MSFLEIQMFIYANWVNPEFSWLQNKYDKNRYILCNLYTFLSEFVDFQYYISYYVLNKIHSVKKVPY